MGAHDERIIPGKVGLREVRKTDGKVYEGDSGRFPPGYVEFLEEKVIELKKLADEMG